MDATVSILEEEQRKMQVTLAVTTSDDSEHCICTCEMTVTLH